MLSTALGFPKFKRVTDDYSTLAGGCRFFPKVAVRNSTEQVAKLSFISLQCMHGTERIIIFTNRKFVAIYIHSTLQEKTGFLQER